LLADTYGFTVAFVVAGCAGLFAASVAWVVLPDLEPDVDRTGSLREIPAVVRSDPRIASVGAVNFVVRFLFVGILLSTVVLYAAENGIAIGALSETGVSGVVMALAVLGASVTTVSVGRYSDRLDNRALIAIPALGVLGVGFGVLALVPTLVGALGGVALIGVGVGGTNPPLLAYLGDISPGGDIGKLGGVYNTFGDLGSTLGPLVALPLVAEVGFTVEYLACVLLVVLTGVLVAGTLLGGDRVGSSRERPARADDD
jgi:MFS family permease